MPFKTFKFIKTRMLLPKYLILKRYFKYPWKHRITCLILLNLLKITRWITLNPVDMNGWLLTFLRITLFVLEKSWIINYCSTALSPSLYALRKNNFSYISWNLCYPSTHLIQLLRLQLAKKLMIFFLPVKLNTSVFSSSNSQ